MLLLAITVLVRTIQINMPTEDWLPWQEIKIYKKSNAIEAHPFLASVFSLYAYQLLNFFLK